MRRKIILFIIIIGALAVLAPKLLMKKRQNNSTTEQKKEVVINTKTTEKSVQQKLKELKKKETTITPEKAEPVEVIATVFDQDPVVDAAIILKDNVYCFRYLSYKENSEYSQYLKSLEEKQSPKQRAYYKKYFKHCEELNKQHPEYHLTDVKKLRLQKEEAVATSTWGKIINGEINADDLSETEINDLLKQNSLTILSEAPKLLNDHYQKVIHWDLEDVLGNHQYDYTNIIQYYAHQLYLCSIGSNCSESSTIMATLCTINAESCGMNYQQYIDNILTQGQQADIQLALDYFKGTYQ